MSSSSSPTSPISVDAPKQLHPSESQLAAEQTEGAPPSSIASHSLAAPKPTVIETRAGPVSPKVSPRLASRTLGGGTGSGGRSPAYSANSSPRGASSRTMASVDDFPNLSLDRRGSGSGAALLGGAPVSGSGSLSNSSSASSLLQSPTPVIVRRASKPFVLNNGTNASLQALLSKHTVADVQSKRASVVELPSTASPAEGFELLLKHSVLSCPVYDAAQEQATGKKVYIGFLDVRDLVSSIVFAHEEQNLAPTTHDQWSTHALELTMKRFGAAVSVTYLARRNPFKPISSSTNLLQVASLLSTHLHRLPVVDADGKCIGIISQSSLITFLYAHRDEVRGDLSQTISSLGLGLCKVISVASDATAWQAFKVLETNNVSGIAIVDRDGKLVANTSARDLKHFLQCKGGLSLDSPIVDYLARIRQRDFHDEVHPSSSVGVGTSVAHCIGLLAATGYHRVFIVDSNGRPIGVVSVTDVLRFAAADVVPSGSLVSSSTSSSPSTPRGSKRTGSDAPPSPATAAITPSPKQTHLRTHSQSTTPIVTPLPSATN